MSGFHDIQFPTAISYGSKGGPQFNTTVLTLASGIEKRNINWSQVQAKYDVAHGIKTLAQMQELLDFFYARYGRGYSFRFKDFLDYQIIDQDLVSTTATRDFQIIKTYSSGGFGYNRLITKIVPSSISGVTIDDFGIVEGDGFSVDNVTGNIHILGGATPGIGTTVHIGYCEFDVHVRFDTDGFEASHEFFETLSWQSIPLVEIKEQA